MKVLKISSGVALAAILLLTSLSACAQPAAPSFAWEPGKTYATFLVMDSESGRNSLEMAKGRSLQEGLEVGPIEYYKANTKDFAPAMKNLTASKQVSVVWIIASVWDVNTIKDAQVGLTYAGDYRYVPVGK